MCRKSKKNGASKYLYVPVYLALFMTFFSMAKIRSDLTPLMTMNIV